MEEEQEERMIKGIKFASVPVTDQERALQFYTRKLGFRVVTDAPFGDQRWIELGLPRAETKLVLFTAPGQEKSIGGFMPIAFMTDDVFATAKEMKAQGVEFVQEPKKEDWGTSAIFKDADGNQFVLGTP
jgi:lactoylglutathione lyase